MASSEAPELRKPIFVKVTDLEKQRSGYNVIVKVISIEPKQVDTRDGQKIKMVDAVVADETGCAKAFFKGENAAVIEKGAVIAIRNGVKKFIKNFISLELDMFGRVTLEKNQIVANTEKNISEVEHKLSDKPRRDNFRGGPRGRRGGNRGFRGGRYNDRRGNDRRGGRGGYNRDDGDRRPARYNREDNRPQRNFDPRDRQYGARRENFRGGFRDDFRDNNRKDDGYRRDFRDNRVDNYRREDNFRRNEPKRDIRSFDRDDRRVNRDYADNRPDRRGGDRYNARPPMRSYDQDFDRKREDFNRGQGPRRDPRYEARRQEFRDNRAPVQWTKIEEISPGDDRLNIIAKVISEQVVQGRRIMVRCVIGDETGIVNAFFPDSQEIRKGLVIALNDCEAKVNKEHIQLQTGRGGRITSAKQNISRINEEYNVSGKCWVPVE